MSYYNYSYHRNLDVNRDGRVDFNDGLIIGQSNYSSYQQPYNNYLDVNRDGRVDFKDGLIIGTQYRGYYGNRSGYYGY
jgi:hypothetical protein